MTGKPDEKTLRRLSEYLCHRASLEDLTFNVASNTHLTVQMNDTGAFKRVATTGEESFFFRDIRYGKRGTAIFVMFPADERPYEIAEIGIKDLSDQFPGFSDWFVDLAGELGCESTIVKNCLEHLERFAAELLTKEAEDARLAQVKADAAVYTNNELFGMF